jgi:hypothetical protein
VVLVQTLSHLGLLQLLLVTLVIMQAAAVALATK